METCLTSLDTPILSKKIKMPEIGIPIKCHCGPIAVIWKKAERVPTQKFTLKCVFQWFNNEKMHISK